MSNRVGIQIGVDGAQAAGASLNYVAHGVSELGSRMAHHLGFAAITYEAVAMGRELMEFGSKMVDLSKRTGLSTDTLQAWSYAAEKSGASLETFTGAYRRLRRAMGMAEGGNAGMIDKLAEFGITDFTKPEAAFEHIGELLKGGNLTMEQMSMLTVILGRNMEALIPAFQDGFSELKAEFAALGVAVDGGILQNLKDANDRLHVLGLTIRKDLAPAFAALAGFADRWWTNFKVMAAGVGGGLGGAYEGLMSGGIGGMITGGFEGMTSRAEAVIEEATAIATERTLKAAEHRPEPPGGETSSIDEKKLRAAGLRGGTAPRSADALGKLGASLGGLDTTVMHSDLVSIEARLSMLVRHAARISRNFEGLDSEGLANTRF